MPDAFRDDMLPFTSMLNIDEPANAVNPLDAYDASSQRLPM
jgi:hypothetical protein